MEPVRNAVLLLTAAVVFWTALLRDAPALAQDNVAFAQQRFARGVQLYDKGEYPPAATEFEASLQLYESPNSRLYLARAYRKLGRLGEAVTEYQRAERESADRAGVDPRYAATRDAATAEIAELQPQVARVVVKVSPGPRGIATRVAGRMVPEAALGLPIAVTPGRVEVRVSAPGYTGFHDVLSIAARQESSVNVTLVPEVSDSQRTASRLRWGGWTGIAVGAAALGAGGVFALTAQRQYHDLVSTCGFAACVPAQPDTIASGRRWERLMEISLIAGGIATVGGGVLLLLGTQHASGAAERGGAAGSDGDQGGGGGLTVTWSGRALMMQGRF